MNLLTAFLSRGNGKYLYLEVVPTDEVGEAAAFPPHLVLLLLHHVLEGELAADLAGSGTFLDLVEGGFRDSELKN